MKLFGLLRQLGYLRTSVHSVYGKGVRPWLNFIYYGLFRINRFRIFRVNLEDRTDSEFDVPGVEFFNFQPKELDPLRSVKDLPREFFCDQFHKVSGCCMATFDGEIAYIHWVYLQGDFSRFLKIGRDSAEINYVITLPEYRGHGISSAAFKYSMQTLKQQGIRNLFAVVHDENIASIKSFTRAGFTEVGNTFSFGQFNRKVSV